MESMLSSLPVEQRAEFRKQIYTGKKNAEFFKKIKPFAKSDFAAFKKRYAEYPAQEEINQERERLIWTIKVSFYQKYFPAEQSGYNLFCHPAKQPDNLCSFLQ